MSELTAERLRELLHYDPETGVFTWINITSRRVSIGDVAGMLCAAHGYVLIGVDGRTYRAHRLAWLYTYGVWPTGLIDHRDGDRSNNVLSNLRDASRMINQQNFRRARADNKAGLLGVSRDGRRGNWVAYITAAGRRHYLGAHNTPEEAHQAYLTAKRRLHEGCTI